MNFFFFAVKDDGMLPISTLKGYGLKPLVRLSSNYVILYYVYS
jgi:hypothetical protein